MIWRLRANDGDFYGNVCMFHTFRNARNRPFEMTLDLYSAIHPMGQVHNASALRYEALVGSSLTESPGQMTMRSQDICTEKRSLLIKT